MIKHFHRKAILLFSLFVALSCRQSPEETATPLSAPAPTRTVVQPQVAESSPVQEGELNFVTIATDAPSRFQLFEDIDPFGNVVGFDPDVMAALGATAGFEYEFVVTGFSGMLESVANGEFDLAMSALTSEEQPVAGLAYSIPYLEVGQVLLVRANERVLASYSDITFGVPIGAQRFTSGEQTARAIVGLVEPDLQLYDSSPEAVQALIDRKVEGVILDSDDAQYFADSYPQQLKIAGGEGQEAWISRKAYTIAVNAEKQDFLESLNQAILQVQADDTMERLTRTWLVSDEPIAAGESLVGTPASELVIGVAGQVDDLDTADIPDLVRWELQINTKSGLLMYDAQNNLTPVLAADFPVISEDGLSYTFNLRPALTFPDGSAFTAEDVRFSIIRAAQLGNFQVNHYLKDDNEDNFADADAVEVVDPLTVKLVLQEPASFFPSLVATPPYFVVSQACFAAQQEPAVNCGGIGPYSISEWERGAQMRLQANPGWPGEPAAFENIQIRFYNDPDRMRRSLENSAIDIAWTGMDEADRRALQANPAYSVWEGASAFKSYLVFNHEVEPWSNGIIREAVAVAIDRAALADQVFGGSRKPLRSPIPDTTPGHVPTEPGYDLERARSLLAQAGYSAANKLELTIWYVDDGRYTRLEADYAAAIAEQLEASGIIEVLLEGAPWEVFRPQSLSCNYPAYLLGWPSSGQPAAFLDAMSWIEYFIINTDSVCSNYESPAMDALLEQAREENGTAERLEIYSEMQALWAEEFPTLDLTQEPRVAISLPNVKNVVIDAMGLLHYDLLVKSGG